MESWLLYLKNQQNYRPVIISTVFTKLLEMYVLYESDQHIFSNYQFGFIRSRGTDTAISLVQDVGEYLVNNGSQMYCCSLDAEGAFDRIQCFLQNVLIYCLICLGEYFITGIVI